jgi:hypothetical protein
MNTNLSDPALWSRFQFGFTLIYHYLFPQLTMGLALFLVYWKWRALRAGSSWRLESSASGLDGLQHHSDRQPPPALPGESEGYENAPPLPRDKFK